MDYGVAARPGNSSDPVNGQRVVIRDDQMDALAAASAAEFENRVLKHLERFAPKHYAVLKEDGLRSVIRYGWRQAEKYGFSSERSVRIYIQLVLMLGAGFDSDPQLPWAAEMLNDRTAELESGRINPLHEKAWEYAEAISRDYEKDGRLDFSRFIEQIPKLRQQSTDPLGASAIPAFRADVLGYLKTLFPHKCDYIGNDALDRLMELGVQSANSHALNSRRGVFLFILLMFILGSGFADDPQLPWAQTALKDKKTAEDQRVDRLIQEGVKFLDRWWDAMREPRGAA